MKKKSKAQVQVLRYGGTIRRLRGIQANLKILSEEKEFTTSEIRMILRNMVEQVKGVEGLVVDKWHWRDK